MIKLLRWISYVFPYLGARWALKLFLTPRRFNRPESEKIWFELADQKKLKCGYAIHQWGDISHPKVLLVHGWEGRGVQLGAFSEPLVNAGFCVIALDGPAHGDSPGVQTNAGDFSRALIAAQQELGSLKAIVAHSFGGGCTLLATKSGLKVDQIITIASPSDYLKVVENAFGFMRISSWSKKIAYNILEKRAGLSLSEINIALIAESLTIPGLIIHDHNDKEVGVQNAIDLNQSWPDSKILLTTELGHRRILKDPEVVQAVLSFIQKDVS
jgi:pimeloyl-ACP methyl ester carboxylesterase